MEKKYVVLSSAFCILIVLIVLVYYKDNKKTDDNIVADKSISTDTGDTMKLSDADLKLLQDFPAKQTIDEVEIWLEENNYLYVDDDVYSELRPILPDSVWSVVIDKDNYNNTGPGDNCLGATDKVSFKITESDDIPDIDIVFDNIAEQFDGLWQRLDEYDESSTNRFDPDTIIWENEEQRIKVSAKNNDEYGLPVSETTIVVSRTDVEEFKLDDGKQMDTHLLKEIPLDNQDAALSFLKTNQYSYGLEYEDQYWLTAGDGLNMHLFQHDSGLELRLVINASNVSDIAGFISNNIDLMLGEEGQTEAYNRISYSKWWDIDKSDRIYSLDMNFLKEYVQLKVTYKDKEG